MARLRQAVIAARDLDAAVAELRAALPLGEPYADPDVAFFGLRNAVMALGDTFVEVVSPVRDGTAAGRFLDRRGDGPYMAMFEVEDLEGARARAAGLGVREVWSVELDDISAVHLHPADMGAAIVSLDRPVPPGSWRWAGSWRPHGDAHLSGLTLAGPDPDGLAARWTAVLGGGARLTARAGARTAIAALHVTGSRAPVEVRAAGTTFAVAPRVACATRPCSSAG